MKDLKFQGNGRTKSFQRLTKNEHKLKKIYMKELQALWVAEMWIYLIRLLEDLVSWGRCGYLKLEHSE